MLTRAAHDDRGFLLVEAIVAMALLSIAFALFAEFASMMTNRNATLSRQAYLSSQARAALDTFSDDIEGGVCNGTGSSGTQPITNATTTSITFYSADRQSPYHLRQITYTLTNGALYRQQAVSTNTYVSGVTWSMGPTSKAALLVDSVKNTTLFHYYSSAYDPLHPTANDLGSPGTTTATLRKVLRVSVTLTTTPTASHGTGSLTTQGQATVMSWLTAPTDTSGVPICPS